MISKNIDSIIYSLTEDMTCDDVLTNGFVFVDVYMYICGGQIRIWIVYIYGQIWIWIIYFFAEKSTVGAVLDWTALTNTHSRGGWWYNRPYRSPLQGQTSRPYRGHCRGGWKHQPPLQRALQWRSGNRPYRGSRAAPIVNFCSSASSCN